MIGINTSTLRPDVTLGFDLHLHISGKFLLYIRKTDNIEPQRLERLYSKNVRKVFIQDGDQSAYEQFLKNSATDALTNPGMGAAEKANVVVGQAKAAVEEMFANPEKKENFVRTEAVAANQVALLIKEPLALEHMLKIQDYDKTTYQHSVNVATIAIGLANALGAPKEVCQAVGTGALLHDIGKRPASAPTAAEGGEQAKEVHKALEAMTQEERDQYWAHPRMGAGALQGKKYISKDILDIILLHEERLDGKGFPAGLKKLDQIFQLVGLANLYDRQVTLLNTSPQKAYESILAMRPLPYDEELVIGLKDVLVANKILQA